MFTHLHNHTQYSLLDGLIKVKDFVNKAKEFKMNALAITDHGNLFGVPEFFKVCIKESIQPIIGFEAYINQNNDKKEKYNHLILIAKNRVGWDNIMKLCSYGYTDGFYYKPRINFNMLGDYSEGIICMAACAGGVPQRHFMNNDDQKAIESIELYRNIFGDDYYLEIQKIGIDGESELNQKIIEAGSKLDIPIVATNDIHFLNPEDYILQDVAMCISMNKKFNDEKRFKIGIDQIYFKSEQEMRDIHNNQHCDNTQLIVEKCDPDIDIHNKIQLPVLYDNVKEKFRKDVIAGIKQKYTVITDEIKERTKYEISIISKMDFEQYILMVQDICKIIDSHKIMRNCRGSAAGSIVCYALDITKIDPLKHGLLFERFLNPARISMPDVDLDLEDVGRETIINELISKYGAESVGQIITHNTLKPRAAFKDVASVMEMPFSISNKIAKGIDQKVGKISDIADSIDLIDTPEIIDYAEKIQGNIKNIGIHPAGILIAPKKITEFVPVYTTPKLESVAAQVSMDDIEDFGLIKFDLLGLATLNIISETIKLIDKPIDIWNIPLDDNKVYKLFHDGDLANVFQYESEGIQQASIRLKPTKIGDISALGALYRPGPIGEIPKFCDRKHGIEKVKYPHNDLKEVLDDTYGIIVYQEQIMQIAQKMCGFSLSEADILRKAVSKKVASKIAEMREKFCTGAKKQGYDSKIANKVYDLIEYFASYGFNRAHAMSYAHISYFCAWLKVYYPLEFYTGVLTNKSAQSGDKFKDFIKAKNEGEKIGITILSPDINQSMKTCVIEDGKIRLPLNSIKCVGKISDEIINNRNTPYTLDNFLSKNKIDSGSLKALVGAGVFDSIEPNRAIVDRHFAGQSSFLDCGHIEWSKSEIMEKEIKYLGYYSTAHPLKEYKIEIDSYCTKYILCATIDSVKKHTQKNGETMAFVSISTMHETLDFPMFSELYSKIAKKIKIGCAYFIKVRSNRGRKHIENVFEAENFSARYTKKIIVDITDFLAINELKEYIDSVQDNVCELILRKGDKLIQSKNTKICRNHSFIKELSEKFNLNLKLEMK